MKERPPHKQKPISSWRLAFLGVLCAHPEEFCGSPHPVTRKRKPMPSRASSSAAIRREVTAHRREILALFEELVNCASFTHGKAGVDRVGKLVARAMPKSFSHEILRRETVGHHHVFRHEVKGALPIVLAGHLDTLCPEDPAWNRLTVQGDTLMGPGVNDMKAGDVTIVWAIKILELLDLLPGLPVVCIFNSDEEIGSPDSHALFSAMGGKAAAALVFECGGPAGTVVTTRKGIARYRLEIAGKAAHFGNLKGAKVSAVEELAHKILAIEALNASDRSIVANAGMAEGGLAANAVAERAVLEFEARYWDPALREDIEARIRALSSEIAVPGCLTTLTPLAGRPPMQPTPESIRLFDRIVDLARRLGQTISEEKRGGVSDACWLSQAGIPTVDGLGPLGDHDFTRDEYIVTETLFQRIELAANLLLEITGPGTNGADSSAVCDVKSGSRGRSPSTTDPMQPAARLLEGERPCEP
jgi:glutamate carboxypeptidase